MTKPRKVVIGGCFISLTVCAGTYTQLNWYGRAALVGFVISEDWPLAWGSKRHFATQRKGFDTVAAFFAENQEVEFVSFSALYPESLCAKLSTDGICQKLDNDQLRRVLEILHVSPVFRTDGGIVLYIAPARMSVKDFDIAYVHFGRSRDDREQCNIEGPSAEIGACDLILDENWYLSYVWRPSDVRRLEQLLGE